MLIGFSFAGYPWGEGFVELWKWIICIHYWINISISYHWNLKYLSVIFKNIYFIFFEMRGDILKLFYKHLFNWSKWFHTNRYNKL